MRDTCILIIVGSWLTAGLLTACNHQSGPRKPTAAAVVDATGAMCEPRMTTPKRIQSAGNPDAGTQRALNWMPKINERKSPGPRPAAGFTWIPGGSFWMGSEEPNMPDARPLHRVYVDGFWMNETEVTNEQFSKFAKSTGYVTVAERK